MIRTYSELIKIPTFEGRFEYLRLNGKVGEQLFGYARYLNQVFYQSDRWKKVRREVALRDKGFDLGVEGYEIQGFVYVHHMNPITLEQIKNDDPCLIDPEFLITCSDLTHRAITLGDPALLPKGPVIRFANDMCPWKL